MLGICGRSRIEQAGMLGSCSRSGAELSVPPGWNGLGLLCSNNPTAGEERVSHSPVPHRNLHNSNYVSKTGNRL